MINGLSKKKVINELYSCNSQFFLDTIINYGTILVSNLFQTSFYRCDVRSYRNSTNEKKKKLKFVDAANY